MQRFHRYAARNSVERHKLRCYIRRKSQEKNCEWIESSSMHDLAVKYIHMHGNCQYLIKLLLNRKYSV